MSTYESGYGSGTGGTSTTQAAAGAAVDKVGDVASAATDHAAAVTSTAKEQASRVASEAADQALGLVDQAKRTVWEQGENQTNQLASAIRDLHGQGQALLAGRPQEAPALTGHGQDVVDRLERIASRLESGGLRGAIDDLSSFARRRPGTFLAGAAAAGFLAGRLARATHDSGDDGNQSAAGGGGVSGAPGPVAGQIPAVTTPATVPPADPSLVPPGDPTLVMPPPPPPVGVPGEFGSPPGYSESGYR